jgi:hypothetical protein
MPLPAGSECAGIPNAGRLGGRYGPMDVGLLATAISASVRCGRQGTTELVAEVADEDTFLGLLSGGDGAQVVVKRA